MLAEAPADMRSIKALEVLAALAWLVAPLVAVAGTRANPLFVVDPATRGRGVVGGWGVGDGGGWGGVDEGGPFSSRPHRPPVPPEPDLPPAEEIPSAGPDMLIDQNSVPTRAGPRGRQAAIAQSQAASALLPYLGAEGDPASELSGGRLGPFRNWPPGCEAPIMQPPAASALPTRPGAPSGFPWNAAACAALCPVPVHPGYTNHSGLGLYKAHWEELTWFDAKAACEREGADLVVINSEQEATMISNLMNYFAEVNYFHVGFLDVSENGTYITVFGDPLSSSGYNVWKEGEPNDVGTDNCGSIHKNKGLNDMGCFEEHFFLCELSQ